MKLDKPYMTTNSTLPKKRVSIVFSLIRQCLLLLTIAFITYTWLINIQFKTAMQQQTDALGQSLLSQTAERATELLTMDDKLGLNILLGSVAKNPLVADITIYDERGNVLFRAGLKQLVDDKNTDIYKESISIQTQKKGELRLRLNKQQIQQPWFISIERAVIIGGILLLIALLFTFKVGRKITSPLIQLKEWLRDPTMPTPGSDQQDELGDLARELQSKLLSTEQIEAYYAQFIIAKQPNVNEVSTPPLPTTTSNITNDELTNNNFDQRFFNEICSLDKKPNADQLLHTQPIEETPSPEEQLPIQTAILLIRLGRQEKLKLLPKDRLINLLQRYRDCLDQTTRLYKGEIHTLTDGSSLVLFHGRGHDSQTYLSRAICCGELMRGLSYELQVELADTDITLLLQIALAQGTELLGLSPQQLVDNNTVQMVKSLADHSRNLLLMDQSIATDTKVATLAKVRALANPADTYCIERVMEPYAEVLEKQLRGMRSRTL